MNLTIALLLAVVALAGCRSRTTNQSVNDNRAELLARRTLTFTKLVDPKGVGSRKNEARHVIISAAQYRRVLGHAPPDDVNFAADEIVVLYDAGVKRSGGYTAAIERIEIVRSTLVVITRLESPGRNCLDRKWLTHPYALVKLQRPRSNLTRVQFDHNSIDRNCDAPRTCEDITCPDGQHCEVKPVFCIRAPCPALAQCVPDKPPPLFCGGIAGIPCPGMGQCIDDPSDDCDPDKGGADCGGLCTCDENVSCKRGQIFDAWPDVCACVPDPSYDPCAAVRCRAGTHCEAKDDSATCVADPFCGGITGVPCPGAATCVDNPNDDCDPEKGGADCGGYCQCNALGFCLPGYVWDSSPSVCNCVPVTNPCTFTLCQTGTTCEVIDGSAVCLSDGTMTCGPNTCAKGKVCCNASCGICTAPGMFCTQQACLPTQ